MGCSSLLEPDLVPLPVSVPVPVPVPVSVDDPVPGALPPEVWALAATGAARNPDSTIANNALRMTSSFPRLNSSVTHPAAPIQYRPLGIAPRDLKRGVGPRLPPMPLASSFTEGRET